MTMSGDQDANNASDGEHPLARPARRTVLALGAIAASTVVTIRPALAQTAGSVLHCQIPVPANQAAGSYISADGSVVARRHARRLRAAAAPDHRRGGQACCCAGGTPPGLRSRPRRRPMPITSAGCRRG